MKQIIELLQKNLSDRKISNVIGVSRNSVVRIRHGYNISHAIYNNTIYSVRGISQVWEQWLPSMIIINRKPECTLPAAKPPAECVSVIAVIAQGTLLGNIRSNKKMDDATTKLEESEGRISHYVPWQTARLSSTEHSWLTEFIIEIIVKKDVKPVWSSVLSQ